MSAQVRCLRGGVVESVHRIHVAVVDPDGQRVAEAGDPERKAFYRSGAKPLQALPLVEEGVADSLGMSEADLAVCCASHNAEAEHLAAVRSVLEKADRTPEDLECGPHPPLRKEVAESLLREGREFTALHNNCSGKHAGMLALAAVKGWPVRGYVSEDHPVQRRMLDEVARWTERPASEIGTGTDGCGVLSFAVPLSTMAVVFARLARAAADGEEGPARIVAAMTGHPFLVAGTDRLDTAVMEEAGEALFVKTGAEGVHCAGLPGRGLGVALKVEDGGRRASDPALVRVLEELEVLTPEEAEALSAYRRPSVRNTRGETVGSIRAEFGLRWHG